MEKTFSCRIDEDIHAKIKAKLVNEGISLQEWLTSKILDDVEVKTDDSATKISDFHDNLSEQPQISLPCVLFGLDIWLQMWFRIRRLQKSASQSCGELLLTGIVYYP